ncbi:hypothetical protein [Marispirochaeta aestuarii]|uniref:hypothetical protein n=1 Tax=Marispirochaeta aestuarii TaxID=1963862 RepID=UPI002ABD6A4C|nr:hypothetical protein [Marispirochaeta aestuarii]
MGPVKSRLLIILMIPAIAAPAFSSGPRERAQENAVNPAPETEASSGHLGGFQAAEKDNPHVIESIRFLNAEMDARGIRVQEVRSSEIQVVSGYKVHLVADYRKNGSSDVLDALIYLPPRGEPQLLSVTYGAE